MKLTKYSNRNIDYTTDETGKWQGYACGVLPDTMFQYYVLDHVLRGECRVYDSKGNIIDHSYRLSQMEMIDLLENPVTEEEKVFLKLKHGGDWITDDQNKQFSAIRQKANK